MGEFECSSRKVLYKNQSIYNTAKKMLKGHLEML